MSITLDASANIAWWKEPPKAQWNAYVAAWLGWTLDAFDFTIFLLIMVPIAKEFDVPLTACTVVFTITLWLRLVGATAAGWMADRMGRKTPLMISILWYSLCNFMHSRPQLSPGSDHSRHCGSFPGSPSRASGQAVWQ